MKLAIFDFDGTLFLKDTLPYLLKLWSQFKYPRTRLLRVYMSLGGLYVRYKLGLYDAHRRGYGAIVAMNKFIRIFSGMSHNQIDVFFDRCCEDIVKHLNKDVVEEIRRTKNLGCHTVLLSGCFEYLLESIGRPLGIDTIIGTKINFPDDGIDIYSPLDVVYGREKMLKLRSRFDAEQIDWEGSFSYADSISDIEVLEAVGNPIAVNPAPELKQRAEESGWRIMISR